MQGATDLGAAYAKERRQYGAPIGSFQAVQHLLADALVLTEGARSIALYAAWAVDALDPTEAVAAAATAKAYATRAARTACETSIQVHGGIGNTWECLAHVFLRRSLLSGDAFGGVDANLARVLDHRQVFEFEGHDHLEGPIEVVVDREKARWFERKVVCDRRNRQALFVEELADLSQGDEAGRATVRIHHPAQPKRAVGGTTGLRSGTEGLQANP